MHPGWRQEELLAACRAAGVHVTAYAPLGRGALLADPAARPKPRDPRSLEGVELEGRRNSRSRVSKTLFKI